MSGVEPEELRRLLAEAVEPVRPGPEGYDRIKAGIARRHRWRTPLAAAVGLALAAIAGVIFLTFPSGNTQQTLIAPAGTSGSYSPSRPSPAPAPPAAVPPTRQGPSTPGSSTRAIPTQTGSVQRSPSPRPTPTTTRPSSATTSDSATPLPATPVRTPALDGDIDGDGRVDAVRYAGGEVVATLSRLGTRRAPLTVTAATPTITATDIDHDGYAELVVRTNQTASGSQYAVLRLVKGTLGVTSGAPLPLKAGRTPTHGDGFRCTAQGTIVVVSADSTDGVTYVGTTTEYRLAGGGLQAATSGPIEVNANANPSPFTARCGPLAG